MASSFKSLGWGLFFCLAAPLIINSEALAFGKKESSALSHYIMGAMYEGLGQIDNAAQEYKKALKADSSNSLIHLNLASVYIKKNDILKAIEELNLAAHLEPEAVEPHAILALLYSSQGKPDLAAGEYETALKNAAKLEPKNIDIYRNLGAVYLQQKKYKEAAEAYQLIVDLSASDAEAHFYLGSVQSELKNNRLAEQELKKALELKPDFHEALNSLGYLYVEEDKNLGQAEAMIRKALEMSPANGAYIDSLGWLYFKKGKFREALKELERAGSLLEDAVIYDHLGDAYLKIGDGANAKLNWQKSLKLDPNNQKVKNKIGQINKAQITNDQIPNTKQ